MDSELQRMVDTLARRVGRPVTLEDPRLRMVAHSSHRAEDLDRVRRDSIMHRRATPEVVAWFAGFGISEAVDAIRIPGNTELEVQERVMFPVRHRDVLLGHLWFLDPAGSLDAAALSAVEDHVPQFALEMYRQQLAQEFATQRDGELVRRLLDDDHRLREHAARELEEVGQLTSDQGVVALVLQPCGPAVQAPTDALQMALEEALVGARRRLGRRRALHLTRFDHGVLIDTGAPARARELADDLALSSEQELGRLPGVEGVHVGIGSPVHTLVDVVRSHERARRAVAVARSTPAFGVVVDWEQLGVYRLLAQVSADELQATMHPALVHLAAEDDLLDTLEAFLDGAGNVAAVAEQLGVHRSTLYNRLARIQQRAEVDLDDGTERLALHLGLKLRRLGSVTPP